MDGDRDRRPREGRDDQHERATPDSGAVPDDTVPEEDIVPKGSGKQFAEDVADVHEVPTESDSGKGFAEGQAHGGVHRGERERRDPSSDDQPKRPDADR